MIYLTSKNLIRFNKRLNENMGKGQNMIHRGIIDSIVKEAEESDLASKAASVYFYRIIIEHPFFGANRRTALTSTDVFLQLNNHKFNLSQDRLRETAEEVRKHKMSREELIDFFSKNIKKINSSEREIPRSLEVG